METNSNIKETQTTSPREVDIIAWALDRLKGDVLRQDFAKAAGLSPSHLSMVLKGNHGLGPAKLRGLVRACHKFIGVTIDPTKFLEESQAVRMQTKHAVNPHGKDKTKCKQEEKTE